MQAQASTLSLLDYILEKSNDPCPMPRPTSAAFLHVASKTKKENVAGALASRVGNTWPRGSEMWREFAS